MGQKTTYGCTVGCVIFLVILYFLALLAFMEHEAPEESEKSQREQSHSISIKALSSFEDHAFKGCSFKT